MKRDEMERNEMERYIARDKMDQQVEFYRVFQKEWQK